jgi:Signal transduction histidine kinase
MESAIDLVVIKLKYSLRTKLSLSYALVALLLVASISIITNVFLQKQFGEYVMNEQIAKAKQITSSLTQQYDTKTNTWNAKTIESIGVTALEQGMIVKLKDSNGLMVWDATVHNNGLCNQMIAHMSKNMASRYPNLKGGYEEKKYILTNSSQTIGTVNIGYYGPFYYTDNESTFIDTLNNMLIGVALVSLIIALFLGTLMARRISSPITKAINAAKQISIGNYKERINDNSNTSEITELINATNNLAQTLENQDMLRKRLTSDVAHELRTPLATLQSHLEAMIDGVWQPNKERLASCHEEILRMNRLVGDLEKLSKYEGENLILSKSEFDIKELITTIANNFEADFKNKNIKFSMTSEPYLIKADRDKVSQVLINILSNAVKYTPLGGSVSVLTYTDKNFIKISIEDTGFGIPKEDLPYIFERFYRADKSRNRMTGGSGIGLAIACAIIDAHKGNIRVTSEIDKGTQFTISLPISTETSIA